jgi:hypothetical protein
MPPSYKITPTPIPSDLTEIAQRFQNSVVTPMAPAREPVAPPAPMPSVMNFSESVTARHEDVERVQKPRENQPEPIIPASERGEMASPSKPPVGDIGSLNDTLRQLLGRTRDS